ncbi:MAG TPA: hypothetical protein PKK23_09725 [Nitrospirales bacterium]|nr:hypothetical protein [Nitrospirales bacterium]
MNQDLAAMNNGKLVENRFVGKIIGRWARQGKPITGGDGIIVRRELDGRKDLKSWNTRMSDD